MTTRRFAYDLNGDKITVGSQVKYKNKIYLLEDIEYLSWNINQYLTLTEQKNKNKKIKFVSSNEVAKFKGRS